MEEPETIDLREECSRALYEAARSALERLEEHPELVLLLSAEPSALLRALALDAGEGFTWTVEPEAAHWRVALRRRGPPAPPDPFARLRAGHRELERVAALWLRALEGAAPEPARAGFERLAALLRRHLEAEERVLAPGLGVQGEPTAAMAREHAAIGAELERIGESLRAVPPDIAEAAAFGAILCGRLAKHEQREEQELFPLWRAAWSAKSPAQRRTLMARVERLLAQEPPAAGPPGAAACG